MQTFVLHAICVSKKKSASGLIIEFIATLASVPLATLLDVFVRSMLPLRAWTDVVATALRLRQTRVPYGTFAKRAADGSLSADHDP
jgi:hypothetical protein